MPLEYLLLLFLTLVGACIGSFLNVVIYRLPEGKSLVHPPSACPRCESPIAWYDNIPILSWLVLRGRCRRCGNAISGQYPLVEASTAALFGGLFASFYLAGLNPGFAAAGVERSWPLFLVNLYLVGVLFAGSAIDARYYVLPLRMFWYATGLALLVTPLAAAFLPPAPAAPAAYPWASGSAIGVAAGGAVGLAVAAALLKLGVIPRSFDASDLDADQDQAPDAFLAHPAPRSEVVKELLFVGAPFFGAVAGYWVMLDRAEAPPPWLAALAGVVLGYLVGAAVVWATRILGTLAFGKEAMGLGDVHLVAAVGAVAGWKTALVAFFIAPFFGLAWTLASAGLARIMSRQVRVIPYGPHLAAASVLAIAFQQPIFQFLGELFRP